MSLGGRQGTRQPSCLVYLHVFRHQEKRPKNRRAKTRTNLKKYAPRHQNESQNDSRSRLWTLHFRFLLNLDFVQHYKGFAWFSWFLGTPGRPKNDKKTMQKTEHRKRRPKTVFFTKKWKNELKMGSDLDHEFSPNSPPRGLCSDLGPKGGKKEPKDAKRVPKDTKRRQKLAKMIPKSCQNR